MKKIFLSILTLLYLASSSGAMLETHFCMGKVADWSFGNSAGEQCGLCGMQKTDEQANGCCSDQENFLKITDDQKAPTGIAVPSLASDASLPALAACYATERTTSIATLSVVHAPPGSPGVPRHLLISVFRI